MIVVMSAPTMHFETHSVKPRSLMNMQIQYLCPSAEVCIYFHSRYVSVVFRGTRDRFCSPTACTIKDSIVRRTLYSAADSPSLFSKVQSVGYSHGSQHVFSRGVMHTYAYFGLDFFPVFSPAESTSVYLFEKGLADLKNFATPCLLELPGFGIRGFGVVLPQITRPVRGDNVDQAPSQCILVVEVGSIGRSPVLNSSQPRGNRDFNFFQEGRTEILLSRT